MNNIPNIITLLRIGASILLLFTKPFSFLFGLLYVLCGFSDIIDGFIARKLNLTSELGSVLDSIADAAFAIALAFILIPILTIPLWLWICASICALIRILSYIIGFKKFHKFSPLHTYLNKLTGLLLFIAPFFYIFLGIFITGIILSLSGITSSVEELALTIKEKELNRNCKSIFKV